MQKNKYFSRVKRKLLKAFDKELLSQHALLTRISCGVLAFMGVTVTVLSLGHHGIIFKVFGKVIYSRFSGYIRRAYFRGVYMRRFSCCQYLKTICQSHSSPFSFYLSLPLVKIKS